MLDHVSINELYKVHSQTVPFIDVRTCILLVPNLYYLESDTAGTLDWHVFNSKLYAVIVLPPSGWRNAQPL